MVMCFAPDCKHYSEKHGCKFFVFPKDKKIKAKWLKLLRREDREPSKYSLVCSCHFKNRDRANLPTLFEHSKEKLQRSPDAKTRSPDAKKQRILSPEKRAVRVLEFDPAVPSTSRETEIPESRPETSQSGTIDLTENLELLHLQESRTSSRGDVTMEAENFFLKQELHNLTERLNKLALKFSWELIKNDDNRIMMYTGLPTNYIFLTLFELTSKFELTYYYGWSVIGVERIDQLLLTLMKLKLNLHHEDLACRFNISRTTVSNIILTWIHTLHEILVKNLMKTIPSRQKNRLCAPSSFSGFTNCRIIVDCTELYIAVPKYLEKQRLTYSSYKHRNTAKGLVGVAPNGVVTYVSSLYPGCTSDKKIFEHCGIINQLVAGDLILADKGFLISDLLPEGVSLNIPPFLTTSQFTREQVIQTRSIARARIHVERAIRRIKCYEILRLIPSFLFPQASHIFQLCSALTNFQYPLIREVEMLFSDHDH